MWAFFRKIMCFFMAFCIAFSFEIEAKTKKSGIRAAASNKKAGTKHSENSNGKRVSATAKRKNRNKKKSQAVQNYEDEDDIEEEITYEEYTEEQIKSSMVWVLQCLKFGENAWTYEQFRKQYQSAQNLQKGLSEEDIGWSEHLGSKLCRDKNLKEYFKQVMERKTVFQQ